MSSRDRYLERASSRYHDQFRARENVNHLVVTAGRQYLAEHGITGRLQIDIVDKYRLGVIIEPLPGDEKYVGMLSIPYLTPRGCRALKFRRLDGGKPKFAQAAGQEVRLYNTQAYFDGDEVIGIAEGEIDAIVATEMLGLPTLGIPGSEMWLAHKDVWAHLFKNFQRVLILTDGDPEMTVTRNGVEVKIRPGEEFGKTITASLKLKARAIPSPEGWDVSSMVAAGRGEELSRQFGEDTEDEDTVD